MDGSNNTNTITTDVEDEIPVEPEVVVEVPIETEVDTPTETVLETVATPAPSPEPVQEQVITPEVVEPIAMPTEPPAEVVNAPPVQEVAKKVESPAEEVKILEVVPVEPAAISTEQVQSDEETSVSVSADSEKSPKIEQAVPHTIEEPLTEKPLDIVESTAIEEKKVDPMEVAKTLDHDVLLAASRLIAMERLEGMTEARLRKLKEDRGLLDEKILASIGKRPKGAKLSIVAFECNLTLRTMADNLRRLRREGRVRGTGTGRSRVYFVG